MIKSLMVFCGAIFLSASSLLAQVTENPRVEEQSQPDVKIKRVELTDQFTVIHLQFTQDRKSVIPNMPRGFSFPFEQGQGIAEASIWLDPETRLYKPGEIEHKFKLVRAENIPTTSTKQVNPGESVDFVAYFERLTPGIEVFDFYEGRSTGGHQSWNFYGVHIKNPLKKQNVASKKPAPAKRAVAAEKPKPQAAPEAPKAAEAGRPEPGESGAALLKGTIFDSKTKQPIAAQIFYQGKDDSLQLRSSSGKYSVGVEKGEIYQFRITAKGYYGNAFTIAPGDSTNKNAFTYDVYLDPLRVGETISLPNIYFETSKFTLLGESFAELDRLVETMKENPAIRIRIEGHTDNVGDFDKNLELSRKRAESVRDYLIGKGIDAARLEAKGYGATRPLTSGSGGDRSKNRRVEFVVTQM